MKNDYLWSGSGKPDPEIERLERLLSCYRHSDSAAGRPQRDRRFAAIMAVAASVAAAWLVFGFIPGSGASNWHLEVGDAAARQLRVGETVDTGRGTARLSASDVGEVRLEPQSHLRVVRSGDDRERLALRRGTMHALIWAPPRRFVVDTPSATSIDLGCSYELTVHDDGSGLLSVSSGWVAFQAGSTESFIPAGASCRTQPRLGPGLPWYDDSSPAFLAAVKGWEKSRGVEGLGSMLQEARERDALTLWHLLGRASRTDRERVALRFAELVPGTSATRLARGERDAVEAAWNALGIGDAEFWRTWKQQW
jgi:hypothetical protein